jgi:hypothetical protein
MDLEETPPDEPTSAEQKQAIQEYWNGRLQEFEEIIYPVFYARGYSKNTALLVYVMDELDDALVVAAAAARNSK